MTQQHAAPTLKYRFVAFSQYGDTVWIRRHPRKELCEHHGTRSARKIYVGDGFHTGYIVAGLWYDVFHVAPLFQKGATP
jgi:hypothetical protein